MILAQFQNDWYLAQRGNPDIPGCSLSYRRAMPCPPDFQEYRYKTFWHKYMRAYEGIIFYPEIRYKGYQVTPCWWDFESSEPIMRCDMMSDQLSLGDGETAARARHQAILDDGWNHHDPFVYSKLLHVDELEKIEGPPPEGPF